MPRTWNVCIVGAGGISATHAKILNSLATARIKAIVDPDLESAERLAKSCGVEAVFGDPQAVFAEKLCDVAHILVPPDLHHDVACPYIEEGIHVFLEKPMCCSVAEAQHLRELSQKHRVVVGVNQNAVFTPAHLRAMELVRSGRFGRVHHVVFYWNSEIRLMDEKKFSHWMFQSPRNTFFEQGPHPLSIIYDLAGAVKECTTLIGSPAKPAPGIEVVDTWQISMLCEHASAQLFYSIGQDFPMIKVTIILDGGVINVDVLKDRVVVETSAGNPGIADYQTGAALSRQLRRQNHKSLIDASKSILGLGNAADGKLASMRNSIENFYRGIEDGTPRVDAGFGTEVVRMCEAITAGFPAAGHRRKQSAAPGDGGRETCEVAVFGGTGFIGRHVVKRLADAGMRVDVLARNGDGLPEVFSHPLVRFRRGSVASMDDVEEVVTGARYVIDLAFALGNGTWDYVEKTGIGGARNVASCCLRNDIERLIYVSTIRTLDASSPKKLIRDSVGFDPRFESRTIYAKSKSVTERLLLDMHRESGLKVCIVRPGIVVGQDGNPYHGGVAQFHNKQHATCPSRGRHPLPFVLVKDAAEAIFLSLEAASIDGKSYNIVGDVRLTASEYVDELSRVVQRPIVFKAAPPWQTKSKAVATWIARMTTGHFDPFPNFHEISCRAVYGQFDNSEIKQDLGWRPVTDRELFIRDGIDVHRKS